MLREKGWRSCLFAVLVEKSDFESFEDPSESESEMSNCREATKASLLEVEKDDDLARV